MKHTKFHMKQKNGDENFEIFCILTMKHQEGIAMENYAFDKLRAFSDKKENHVTLSEYQIEQFRTLCSLLIEKNKLMNLTAITEPEEIEKKHFIDSLMAVDVIKEKSDVAAVQIIDIGCGAGFPGLPLKIAMPEALFVLADSVSKKISFVNEAIEALKLDKISAEAERFEFLARTQYREIFDFAVSRAVSDMPALLEYCLPFVKVGGHAILYKSADFRDEVDRSVKALEILGGEISEIKEFVLPFSTDKRSIIVVQKTAKTPEKYPRKPGKVTKKPIM